MNPQAKYPQFAAKIGIANPPVALARWDRCSYSLLFLFPPQPLLPRAVTTAPVVLAMLQSLACTPSCATRCGGRAATPGLTPTAATTVSGTTRCYPLTFSGRLASNPCSLTNLAFLLTSSAISNPWNQSDGGYDASSQQDIAYHMGPGSLPEDTKPKSSSHAGVTFAVAMVAIVIAAAIGTAVRAHHRQAERERLQAVISRNIMRQLAEEREGGAASSASVAVAVQEAQVVRVGTAPSAPRSGR